VRLTVKVQRGPAGVVAMAAPQSEDAVSRAESAVASFQVQASQQRREAVADEVLGFLYGMGRGWRQGGQPFEQSCLARTQVPGGSALVDAPVPAVSSCEVLAAAKGRGC
jgi:hypothetical protein